MMKTRGERDRKDEWKGGMKREGLSDRKDGVREEEKCMCVV